MKIVSWSLFFLLLMVSFGCQPEVEKIESNKSAKHFIQLASAEELHKYLAYDPSKPLIGAHRGGPMPGFPENCIESFENVLEYAPCLLECDVRESKDGVLHLMHDDTLERTTNGSGKVSETSWEVLQKLYLKDNDEKITKFRIPTLSEAIKWTKGKAILQLDVKRGVKPEAVVKAIKEHDAAAYVLVITYNIEDAKKYHDLHPELMISASAKGVEGTKRLLESGIPTKNLLGFVGIYEPPVEVYKMLTEKKVRPILGTLGNLDKKAKTKGIGVYVEFLKKGVSVLATDEPVLAAQGIQKYLEEYNKSK